MPDARLVNDIEVVEVMDTTVRGLRLYRLRYRSRPGECFEGVMAEDVLKSLPGAVITGGDGFYRVHYTAFGISLTRV